MRVSVNPPLNGGREVEGWAYLVVVIAYLIGNTKTQRDNNTQKEASSVADPCRYHDTNSTNPESSSLGFFALSLDAQPPILSN